MTESLLAYQSVVIRGELADVAKSCSEYKADGYYVVKVKTKVMWPYFWKRRYKVKMKKDYLLTDEGDLIHTPINHVL